MKFLTGFLLCASFVFGETDFEKARKLYNAGRYWESVKLLFKLEDSPEVNGLVGKNYYMFGDFKKAAIFLERAADSAPKSGDYQLWLGRAYGRQAENTNVFKAPAYASKARRHFERAVELNPSNKEALFDLFEYYLRAPGFLGGGVDKAESLAGRIMELNRAEGYLALAELAEKKKDLELAERHFREAISSGPGNPGYTIALAKFLSRCGRFEESEKVFSDAEKILPYNLVLLFEKADAYIQAKRNLETARELLGRYLASGITPDMPQRYEAGKLLKRISR